MELTLEEAARVFLHCQKLGEPRQKASTKAVLEIVRTIGSLQIDTISVVERSHHLTLYSRLSDYNPTFLEKLLFKHRSLQDYWTNVAAVIPAEDYPYYHYAWSTHREGWRSASNPFLEEVRRRVPKDRPFATDDFEESLQKRRRGVWRSSGLSNALDILVLEGFLTVHHREGFRKFYGRASSQPSKLHASDMNDQKVRRFLIRRSLRSMGVATLREIQIQLARLMPAKEYKYEVHSMVEEGTIETLRVKGIQDDHYMLTEQTQEIQAAVYPPRSDAPTTLLGPFDSLIINRQRALKLFGFYPRFEAYVPKNKRKYGYYQMPILYQQNLVGYIDPKLDRQTGLMTFHTISLNQTPDDVILDALVEEFTRFLVFHDARNLEVKASQPRSVAERIQKEVNNAIRQS